MIPPLCCRVERAGLRRRRLTQAARTLFIERGFHATGMAEIAARSGVKIGQIYRDFANKEAIVAEITQEELSNVIDSGPFAAAITAGDGQAVAREIAALFAHEEDTLVADIFAEASRNPRMAAIVDAIDRRFRDALERALAVIAPTAAAAPRRAALVELLVTLMAGHCGRLSARCAAGPLPPPLRALIDRELAALADGGVGDDAAPLGTPA